MNVLFIDSTNKTVTERNINHGYPDGNKLIGADLITVAGINGEHDLVVDEEGLNRSPRFFFRLKDYNIQPLAGNGFICQNTPEGDWISHNLSPEQINKEIEWFDAEDAGDEYRIALAWEDYNEAVRKAMKEASNLFK